MITLAASDPSIGTMAFRLLGSLAVVVGLLLLIAKFANKKFSAPAGAPVQVMHRQALGRGQGVAVISVAGRVLVVGTTEHQVTLLTELDPEEIEGDVVALDAAEDDIAEDEARDGFDLAGAAHIDPIVAGALGLDLAAEAGGPDGFEAELAGATASYDGPRVVRPRSARPALPAPQGALAGSVLSPQTWKQTFAALTGQGAQAAPPPAGRRAS